MNRVQRISLLKIFLLTVVAFAQGQVIWVEPSTLTADSRATIFFDANECQCPLETYNGTIYAHTGVLYNNSTVWQHVIGSWGDNGAQPALRPVRDKVFALDIFPTISDYYNADSPGEITNLAFVFRSADAATQTADLFVDVFRGGQISIVSPAEDQIFSIGDSVEVDAVLLGADSMTLKLNDTLVLSQPGDQLKTKIFLRSLGRNNIEVSGIVNDAQVKSDRDIFLRRNTQKVPLPSTDLHFGVNSENGGQTAVLVLPAPGKESVFVIGDFNSWRVDDDYQMNVTPDGKKFWLRIENLDPSIEYGYQYLIDEDIRVADPFARKILDPWRDSEIPSSVYPDLKPYPVGKTTDIVSVFQTKEEPFAWEVPSFEGPEEEELVIYELLVRDFVADHSYSSVIDSLDYLESIGINAIELMPVMEFENNDSWGYNPSFHFALDKYYGTPTDFKTLVDECHKRGIAVILDIVLNHMFGQSPLVRMYWNPASGVPSSDNPWFNVVSPNPVFSWGYDFNHESTYTEDYSLEVLLHWLREYKVDGYRLDFTKGLTNRPGDGGGYDASRIRILKNYAEKVWEAFPNAYLILEHFAPNAEEKELADAGMMIWTNTNHAFNQIAMGYTQGSDFAWSTYVNKGFDNPMAVGYMESHDEERMLYKTQRWGNIGSDYDITQLDVSLNRAKMASTLWLTIPGPKMLWMFGELGYDVSIDDPCRVCPKDIKWEYLEEEGRRSLKDHYASLIQLRKEFEIFETRDFDIADRGLVKHVHLRGSDNEVIALANIDVSTQVARVNVDRDVIWYDFFTSERYTSVGGLLDIRLQPGEYLLLSTVPFNEVPPETESSISFNTSTGVIGSLQPLSDIRVYDSAGRLLKAIQAGGVLNYSILSDMIGAGVILINVEDETGYKKIFKTVVTPY